MKKNLSKILVLCLVLSMMFLLAACDKLPFGNQDKGDTDKTDSTNDTTDTGNNGDKPSDTPADVDPSKLLLFENGKAKFQVVFTTKSAATGAGIATEFVERLKKMGALPKDAEPVSDRDASKVKDCEIIIGAEALNRGDECSVSTKFLGKDGKCIKIVGNRVIIATGTPGDVQARFNNFVRNQLGIKTSDKKVNGNVALDRTYYSLEETKYSITSISVAGNDLKDYKLVLDIENIPESEEVYSMKAFRQTLYDASGYWLDVGEASKVDTYDHAFIIRKVSDAGPDGFRAYVAENGNLIVECAYDNAFNGAFADFAANEFTTRKGEIAYPFRTQLNKETNEVEIVNFYTKNVSVVYYEDFFKEYGGGGDGLTDCFEAIYNTHVYANRGGQKVMSQGGSSATYFIDPRSFTKSIPVKTDVDLNGCTFLVDDTGSDAFAYYGTHLFLFDRDVPTITFDDVLLNVAVLDEKGNPTYNKDGTPKMTTDGIIDDERFQGIKLLAVPTSDPENKIYNDFSWLASEGLITGNGALIRLYNKNHRDFVRHGSNQNSGNVRTDVFVVDKDGNISKDTPIVYEFDAITKIEIFGIDDKPITFENGNFINICCRTVADTTYTTPSGKLTKYANKWRGYQRTLGIFRTNVTMRNLKHEMQDEPTVGMIPNGSMYVKDSKHANFGSRHESYPYYGFFYIYTTYNFHAYDSQLTGHTTYYEDKPATASTGGKIPDPVAMGTYDLIVEYSSHVYLDNIVQVNSSTPETGLGDGRYWGIMSSNGARNMFFTNCKINRFDAHRGFWNATLKDVEIGHSFQVVGGGYLIADNVTKITKGNYMTFRGDYGATFNGDITLKNCTHLGFDTYNTARGQKNTTKNDDNRKVRTSCVIFDPGYDISNSGWVDDPAKTIEEQSAGAYWLWYFGYTCYMPRNITIENFQYGCDQMSIFDELPNIIFDKTYEEDNPEFVPDKNTVRYPYQITESITFVDYTELPDGSIRNNKAEGNELLMTFYTENTRITSIPKFFETSKKDEE